jgi:hypothetical protein
MIINTFILRKYMSRVYKYICIDNYVRELDVQILKIVYYIYIYTYIILPYR